MCPRLSFSLCVCPWQIDDREQVVENGVRVGAYKEGRAMSRERERERESPSAFWRDGTALRCGEAGEHALPSRLRDMERGTWRRRRVGTFPTWTQLRRSLRSSLSPLSTWPRGPIAARHAPAGHFQNPRETVGPGTPHVFPTSEGLLLPPLFPELCPKLCVHVLHMLQIEKRESFGVSDRRSQIRNLDIPSTFWCVLRGLPKCGSVGPASSNRHELLGNETPCPHPAHEVPGARTCAPQR